MISHLRLSCLLIIAPLFAAAQPVFGAMYFTAPGGSDSNPGTEAQPWRTLSKASSSVEPGDTVRIRAGEYVEGSGWSVTRAGTADLPIKYQAYGDGEVRITPSWVIPAGNWTHVSGAIYSTPVAQRPSFVFQNAYPLHAPGDRAKINSVESMIPNSSFVDGNTLYVWLGDGSNPAGSVMRATAAHVVNLLDCHYNIFDGLTVEFGYTGFKTSGTTQHVIYRNCTIRSIGNQGIQPVALNAIIENNLFQRIGSNKYQHGIYNSKPGLVVRNNIFEEIAGAAIHQFHQGSPAGGDCRFYGNTFRNPRGMTIRPEAGERNPYYVEIIAWGEGGNQIHDNVFYGEGKRAGVSLNSPNNVVRDNVFVGSAPAVRYFEGRTGNKVEKNVVQDVGATYYVSVNGDDAAPGTIDQPFRSAVKAVSMVRPGDTVVFRAGRYPSLEVRNLNGEADAWITFRAHRGERVTIDRHLEERKDFPSCIYIVGRCSHLAFEGFELTNSNPVIGELRVLDMSKPEDLARWLPYVEGRPAGIHAYGVRIDGLSTPPIPHHLVFRELEIHHLLGMGFSGGGDDLQFIGNHVYDLGRPRSGYGWYTSGDRHIYRGNIVHGTIYGFHLYSEGGKRPLRNSIIENNVIHSNGGVRYYHMTSRKVAGGGAGLLIQPGDNNIIRNNIVIKNGADGIRFVSNNTSVVNNVIHSNAGHAIRSHGTNVVVRDNLFHAPILDGKQP